MSEKQQTAVEWIEGYLKKFNHITESLSLTKAFEKAKEMEKEQIIESYTHDRLILKITAEQYYNETYSK